MLGLPPKGMGFVARVNSLEFFILSSLWYRVPDQPCPPDSSSSGSEAHGIPCLQEELL